MLAQLMLVAGLAAGASADSADRARAAAGPSAASTAVVPTKRSVVSVVHTAGKVPRAAPLLARGSIDSIVVEKSERRLTLFSAGQAVRSYRVALGQNPVGAKRVQGDSRTPEGLYVIDRRNENSKYFRSLHISYPNAVDRFLASEKGYTAGGDVMVHGLAPEFADQGATHWKNDWTEGCVAISNEQMMEMWDAVLDGTPIRIKP